MRNGTRVLSRPRQIKLFLCGDVMLGRGIDQVLPRSCPPRLYEPHARSARHYVALAERQNGPIPRPVGYAYPWGAALDALDRERPDVRIINLETSVTTSARALLKGINYRMHPDNVRTITAAGIDGCVLANNHVLDWGADGLLETLDTLASAGVHVAGAGRDLRSAQAPMILPAGASRRVLVFAFGAMDSGIPQDWAATEVGPGVHVLQDLADDTASGIARLVTAARRPGDVVVASIHWGGNWGYEIDARHRRFAHTLIDGASVDIIHGHSSHHAKAIEVYRGRLILYGCGDFLDDYEGIHGHEAFRDDLVLMYFPTLDADTGTLKQLDMVPLRIRNFRLHAVSAAERAWMTTTLDRECRRFGNRVVLEGGRLRLVRD